MSNDQQDQSNNSSNANDSSQENHESNTPKFDQLGLPDAIVDAVKKIGYETPSPIQAQCIPLLLEGNDLLGQAQTGTGKTAAFALPLLARVDMKKRHPQLLVLAPTRELAIQVAEACQSYAKNLPDFHVLPIYGGQSYTNQLRQLKRGVQVIVGTPGRVMDHMRKGTLKVDSLQALVLDEADEMLRMGFIDDVEWVLEQIPDESQIALFSATMPNVIRDVARRHLKQPKEIKIETKTSTASTIRQRYLQVSGPRKLDAMTRILETEDFDGVIVFVRTKTATVELADKMTARGYACEALNGDIPQANREKVVEKLKRGKLDILIATDVVARGLDVERISHVINYDIPYDTESYVHRIGRTGRAGRSGDAVLFVAQREKRLLYAIERATKQKIELMQLPSTEDINVRRISKFKDRIAQSLANDDLGFYENLIGEFQQESETDGLKIAAALAKLLQGDQPLLAKDEPRRERSDRDHGDRNDRRGDRDGRRRDRDRGDRPRRERKESDVPMQRFKLAVGYDDGVKPGNIVGAIANEADIDSQYIGHIKIHDDFTLVDLPAGMPNETLQKLKKTRVCQKPLNIELSDEKSEGGRGRSERGDRDRGDRNDRSRGDKPPRRDRKDRGERGQKRKPRRSN